MFPAISGDLALSEHVTEMGFGHPDRFRRVVQGGSERRVYKGEVIHNANVYTDAWRGLADVEKATLEWVGWYNAERIHSKLGNRSPNDFEALYWDNLDATAACAA